MASGSEKELAQAGAITRVGNAVAELATMARPSRWRSSLP
jgi:hypothetical protein